MKTPAQFSLFILLFRIQELTRSSCCPVVKYLFLGSDLFFFFLPFFLFLFRGKVGLSHVKILRVLRVLRPLRAINRAKGLKVSIHSHRWISLQRLLADYFNNSIHIIRTRMHIYSFYSVLWVLSFHIYDSVLIFARHESRGLIE